MAIYYIYIAYIYSVSLMFKESEKTRKTNTFFLWIGLFLIMALRADTVGSDISGYLYNYESNEYIYNSNMEIGYLYLLKLFSYLNISKQGYLVWVSFIISVSFSWFFYKYSKNISLSFFLHITIGLFAMSMTGLRQTIAISIVLFAINFVINRKLFSFIVLVLIASLFHQSAIIFFPAYFLYSIKIDNYKSMFYSILALIVLFFLSNYLFSFVGLFVPDRYFNLYLTSERESSGMNLLPILFRLSLPLILILYWKFQNVKINMIPKIDIYFFVLGIVSVVISVLSLNLSVIDRLSYYYYVPLMVLIPNVLNRYKKNDIGNYNIFIGLIMILSILYFSISTPDGILRIDNYKFFWE